MKRITSLLLAIVLFAGLVLTAAPTVRAASEMVASDALVEILKNEEGFSAKPYWDYGQYTVGYGTRCPDDKLEEYRTNGISKEDAEVLLRNYLAGTESVINTKLIDKYGLTLTQSQFDALITFTYNCGSAWIYDTDGVLHNAVKNGTTGSEMIRIFSLWCSAGGQILPGLVRRRLCEANMYLNGEYSNAKPSNYGFVYYNANGGTVDYRIQGYNADDAVAPAYTPVCEGRNFLGWFTEKVGGTQVTVLTAELSGKTLYARWDGAQDEQTPVMPEKGVSIQVTATDVNLRKGPGTNYGIVGTANKGDTMVITETASGTGYE
jgi:GH24 family phage-related lysozyme (muramidase)